MAKSRYREGYEAGFAVAVAFLRTTEAKHSIMEDGRKRTFAKKNHVGPTLMAASLWADWLEATMQDCNRPRKTTPKDKNAD